jgi:hypothetical protein
MPTMSTSVMATTTMTAPLRLPSSLISRACCMPASVVMRSSRVERCVNPAARRRAGWGTGRGCGRVGRRCPSRRHVSTSPVGTGGGTSYGLTSHGVTSTSSSICSSWRRREVNSSPMIGICPRIGMRVTTDADELSSRPAMAKVWPSLSSISVLARRISSVGTAKPLMTRPVLKSSDETSGATRSRIAPPAVMVGRKFRRTPNSRHSMVTRDTSPPLTTGNGNSPPARNDASAPSTAMRSARPACGSRRWCGARGTARQWTPWAPAP